MSFLESAPQITSLSTKSMHERGGVLQLDKYQSFAPNLNVIFGITNSNNPIINKIDAWEVRNFSMIYTIFSMYLPIFDIDNWTKC